MSHIIGTEFDDILSGTSEDDLIEGLAGNDVYLPGLGGQDTVHDASGDDEVRMPAGIAPDQVERLRFDGSNDLVLRVVGTGEQVTLSNWFLDPTFQIERVVFDDGTVWTSAETGALRWLGTAGDDSIWGTQYDETFEGRGGTDGLAGGGGNDVYILGDLGFDAIFDLAGDDEVRLPAGIAPDQVERLRHGSNNLLLLTDTGEQLLLLNWFLDPTFQIERVVFDDGTVWTPGTAPTLENPIADQTAQDEVAFSFTLPENTFSDPDAGDVLTYSAAQSNGDPLPGWLSFDAATRTFEGTPPPAAAGTVTVRVTATDSGALVASDDFDLTVFYDGIITGTPASESIEGTAGDDVILGLGGDDVLDGKAGNDTLEGGDGNDTYVIDDSTGGPTSLTLRWNGQAYSFNLDTGTFIPQLFDRSPDGQIDYVRFFYDDFGFPSDHWFTVDLSTTQLGINFGPGTYLNAERAAFASPGHPGLDVSGDGSGFNTLTGSFTVEAAEFDYSGSSPVLLTLSADFELTSGLSTITGSLDYNYPGAGPAVHDAVIENSGEGVDTVLSRVSYTLPVNVENLTLTGSVGVSGSGNELDNVIVGNAGNNSLSGEAGNDSLSGGAGMDLLDGGTGSDTLQGGTGNDTYVIDGPVVDLVVENPGAGLDTVTSTTSYTLTSNVEVLTLTGDAAIDGTGNELGNLLSGNSASNHLIGGAGSDRLLGGSGNDVLDGGADLDTLQGGLGDDTYVINETVLLTGSTSLAMVSEPGDYIGQGQTYSFDTSTGTFTPSLFDHNQDGQVDYVRIDYRDVDFPFGGWFFLEFSTARLGTAFTPGLYVDAERAAFASPGHPGMDVHGNGRGSNQVAGSFTVGAVDIDYSGSNPVLRNLSISFEQHSESLTAPALFGTLVYNVAPAGATAVDSVIENVGEGTDTVMSAITFALPGNVENLVLTGSGSINGTGNSAANTIVGNEFANVLDGGQGVDYLIGGLGDDLYIVDNAGDSAVESPGEGTDTVHSAVSWTLDFNLENLTLIGTGALGGGGNSLDNVITGNSIGNVLTGGSGGNDTLIGGAGDDLYQYVRSNTVIVENAGEGYDYVSAWASYTLAANVESLTLLGTEALDATGNALANALAGNSGNNVLDGAAGADSMSGGAGDDTYIVDDTGDSVAEGSDNGTDAVLSAVSYSLGVNVENLTLTGTGSINGTGNALDNILTGNSANNTLAGGAGNDVYHVQNAGDVVNENAGEGTDVVNTSVTTTLGANLEGLLLTGTGAVNGTGNSLANLVRGNSGINTLNGGGGFDALEGAGGADTLTDTSGGNYFNGGAGNDVISGGSARDFFMGGTGNDTINTGNGADVIVFNVGDGQDTVNPSNGVDNTLSLGGAGLTYANLTFQKASKDLVLNVSATDKVTFNNWYQGNNNKNLLNLQIIAEAMAAFDPGSSDPLLNKEVQNFDFRGLVDAFDAARTGNPGLTTWALSNALAQEHISGTDDAALGGDLAYLYGLNGTVAGTSFQGAQSIVTSSQFGVQAQGHLIGDPSLDPLKLS